MQRLKKLTVWRLMSFLCKVTLPKEGENAKVEVWKEAVVHILIISIQITQVANKWHKFLPVFPSYHNWVQLWVCNRQGWEWCDPEQRLSNLWGQQWQLPAQFGQLTWSTVLKWGILILLCSGKLRRSVLDTDPHSKGLKSSCHCVTV